MPNKPTQSFNLGSPVKVVNPYGDVDFRYGPYNSIAEAMTELGPLKSIGLVIGIWSGTEVVDYQFKTGTTESDLKEYSSAKVDYSFNPTERASSWTLSNADNSRSDIYNGVSEATATLPLNEFPIGTIRTIVQGLSGSVTIEGQPGVIIQGQNKTIRNNSFITIWQIDTNLWISVSNKGGAVTPIDDFLLPIEKTESWEISSLDASSSYIYNSVNPGVVTIQENEIEVGSVRTIIQKNIGPVSVNPGQNVTIEGDLQTTTPMQFLSIWQIEPNHWISIPSGPQKAVPDTAPYLPSRPEFLDSGELAFYKGGVWRGVFPLEFSELPVGSVIPLKGYYEWTFSISITDSQNYSYTNISNDIKSEIDGSLIYPQISSTGVGQAIINFSIAKKGELIVSSTSNNSRSLAYSTVNGDTISLEHLTDTGEFSGGPFFVTIKMYPVYGN